MSGSILERLQARLAHKPALIDVGTLFSDLEDAHAEIVDLKAQIERIMTTPPDEPPQPPGSATPATIAPHINPGIVAHIHQLMLDAEERMSVNALGTVSDCIAKAKSLLEGKA